MGILDKLVKIQVIELSGGAIVISNKEQLDRFMRYMEMREMFGGVLVICVQVFPERLSRHSRESGNPDQTAGFRVEPGMTSRVRAEITGFGGESAATRFGEGWEAHET